MGQRVDYFGRTFSRAQYAAARFKDHFPARGAALSRRSSAEAEVEEHSAAIVRAKTVGVGAEFGDRHGGAPPPIGHPGSQEG